MRSLFRALATTACLLLGSVVASSAEQSSPKPPANEDCLACHADPDAKRANGTRIAVDAAVFADSRHGQLACVDCHADLAKLTKFPHQSALKEVACASCHDDVGAAYHDSIHARAREKSGLKVAPACTDCHGSHDIRDKADPRSRVSHARIPATCATCHDGIGTKDANGVQGAALRHGNSGALVCTDCHTAHAIQRADTSASRLHATAECGSCHASVVESFTRTFHGKVTQLGSARVAACADCHGAHDIRPASNPASTVAPQHLQATCGKCHQGANARFVQYDPHPNPRDYSRSAVLWWANRFYWLLIPGCFGFFGLHSALWFWRSRKESPVAQEGPR